MRSTKEREGTYMDTKEIRKHLHEVIDKLNDSHIVKLYQLIQGNFREGNLAFLFNFIKLFHNHIPLFIRNTIKQF